MQLDGPGACGDDVKICDDLGRALRDTGGLIDADWNTEAIVDQLD
jgi:hypothetical protein